MVCVVDRSEWINECVLALVTGGRDAVSRSSATTRRVRIQSHALKRAQESAEMILLKYQLWARIKESLIKTDCLILAQEKG